LKTNRRIVDDERGKAISRYQIETVKGEIQVGKEKKEAGDKLYFCRNVTGKTKNDSTFVNGKGEKIL